MAQRSLYAGSVRSYRIIRDAQNADDGRGGWGYVGAPDRIPERSGAGGTARNRGSQERSGGKSVGMLRFSARFLPSLSDGTYEIPRPSGRHDDKQREQN